MDQLSHQFGRQGCPLCTLKLTECEPILTVVFSQMRSIEMGVHISCGWRGEKEQTDAYNSGKSKLRWPYSKHNVLDSEGNKKSRAIDIFFLDKNGKARFYSEWCEIIWESLKPTTRDILRWGGDFKDYLHFELKTGYKPKEIK